MRRQLTIGAAIAVLLTGCSWFNSAPSGDADNYLKGFGGAVAADEPQAALVARDTLVAGGSAADAAVAAYFTMAVTYPSAASLGSGGICLVYDRTKQVVETIDFSHPNVGPHGAVPLPASPRGMLALHAKYGVLPWTQLVGPAEGFARLGHKVSKALARRLAATTGVLDDPSMARIFADKSGKPVAEGENIQQSDLAWALDVIRRQPTRFYNGPYAQRLVRAYRAAGVNMSAAELAGFTPRFRPAITVKRSNQDAFFAPTPGGLVAAQAWAMLFREDRWGDASPDTRAHLVAEVSRRAYADAGRWFHSPGGIPDDAQSLVSADRIRQLMASYKPDRKTAFRVPGQAADQIGGGAGRVAVPVDQGSASVIAADQFGQAVTCAFTMNGAFGARRVAPGTGIVVAKAPDMKRGYPALSLMALGFGSQWQLEYMGAATGGAAGPISLTADAARIMLNGRTPEAVMAMPRYVTEGVPDRMEIEDRPGAQPIADDLKKHGHDVVKVPTLGRLNFFVCPAGFSGNQSQCDIRTDRRGAGFAQLY